MNICPVANSIHDEKTTVRCSSTLSFLECILILASSHFVSTLSQLISLADLLCHLDKNDCQVMNKQSLVSGRMEIRSTERETIIKHDTL